MLSESNEKRRFERVPISLPIKGKCITKIFQNHSFDGQTQDISFHGLCIKTKSLNGFKAGQMVKWKTRLYEGDFSIKAHGEICWIDAKHDIDWPITMGVKIRRIRHFSHWCEKIEKAFQQLR
jgi:hypothetical protein